MPITIQEIGSEESRRVLSTEEGHFADIKAREIAPGKLTRTIAAFSNADGGELLIGIHEDKQTNTRTWIGFETPEDANGHLQAFEILFPLGNDYQYSFLRAKGKSGVVLRAEIAKGKEIKAASDNTVYLRRGAQNLPVTGDEALSRLRRAKGLTTFETETLTCDKSVILELDTTEYFIKQVVPRAPPHSG